MDLILIISLFIASLGVGWSIGANDAANSLGPAVGSKVVTLKQAILLIAVFGLMGALLQGGHVVKTIGKGIVDINGAGQPASLYIALTASVATCIWVALATYWKMPVSTSHAIVGAVAGSGLALSLPIKWPVFLNIFICWLVTPVGAAILSFLLYYLLKWLLYLLVPQIHLERVMKILIILSGCYVAYSWGANDVANATGVIAGTGILTANKAVLIGGAAIIVGVLTWGYKVIETVGGSITNLLPIMALSAQLGSSLNVHVYTLLGVPVSTSHSIVGAIFGVGLIRGVKVINKEILRDILICWLTTPLISCGLSFIFLKMLVYFIKLNSGS